MTAGPGLTVAIVGAGPMGLHLACELTRRGVAHVILERGTVGASIERFPPGMRFLPSNSGLEIDALPLESAGERATREEYLAYLREVVRRRRLDVRTGHEVVKVEREPGSGFRLHVRGPGGESTLRADRVVLAIGEFDRPALLGIPGEDLPHVSHFFQGTDGLAGRRVLIVGGGNSATEAAVALVEAGAQVQLCVRRDRFGFGGDATRENADRVRRLAAAGRLDLRFETRATRIEPDTVHLAHGARGTEQAPADRVLLLTGYAPDLSLLAGAGGSLSDPVPDAMTLETRVPGLYLAGTAATRSRGGRSFIKHTGKHAARIVAHLHHETVPARFHPPPRRRRLRGDEHVSVLIPAWNAAPWIAEAVESALAQTHAALEVVVVDDGSTDGTAAVLETFAGRIRWETTPHRGAGAARNRLLELAEGEWVQYLDADDLLLPGKVAGQLAAARRAPQPVDLVLSPFLNEAGDLQRAPSGTDPWICFFEGRAGTTSSHLFRRAPLLGVGAWDVTRRAAQEQELLGRLLASGARTVFFAEAHSIKRRVNPQSLWRSIWRDDPKAAREADVSAVAHAVRHLRETGALTPGREAAAGARFLLMARSARRRGAGGWEEVLAEAGSLGLSSAALLSRSPAIYRLLYRARGFDGAEAWARALAQARPRTRRWLRRQRGRFAGWTRRARATLRHPR